MCLCIFPHNFLSVIYKIINNTQDITFGEYISSASTFLYNSINNIKAIKQHMITRMSVCISDSVYSIWSFTWQKHDANFYMHIVFFLFNWIELNSCLFPFFFLVIVSVLISASFLLRLNLSLIFYTCWRLNYGSCLVHWTKVVLYWFVFIRFVRWLLMTSSKREYSHSLIFWNELHKQCYKLAIESYEFNLFRSNRIFFFNLFLVCII